jgi:hypothetical protein
MKEFAEWLYGETRTSNKLKAKSFNHEAMEKSKVWIKDRIDIFDL